MFNDDVNDENIRMMLQGNSFRPFNSSKAAEQAVLLPNHFF